MLWFRKYCIRWIKRTVPNKRIPPIFRGNWGTSKCKDRLLMLNLPPEVTNTHTFPLAVSANQCWIPPFQQSLPLSLFIFAAWLYYWPINIFTCGLLQQTSEARWTPRVRRCNNSHYTPISIHLGVWLYGWLTTPLPQKIFSTSTRTVRLIKRIR